MRNGEAEHVLEATGIGVEFDGVVALKDVDVSVRKGELLGLLGPNGSGKSTLFNCISGVLRPTRGTIRLYGENVTSSSSTHRFHAGLGRTFQLPELFRTMTVVENVTLGLQERHGSMLGRLFQRSDAPFVERVNDVITFLRLEHVRDLPVHKLSYGQQKLVDLAIALVSDPDIILLDEPMAGVNPALIRETEERLLELHAAGKTLVIIEHNMKIIMNLCQRLIVLDSGERIAEGKPSEIQADERVLQAYFGGA